MTPQEKARREVLKLKVLAFNYRKAEWQEANGQDGWHDVADCVELGCFGANHFRAAGGVSEATA